MGRGNNTVRSLEISKKKFVNLLDLIEILVCGNLLEKWVR